MPKMVCLKKLLSNSSLLVVAACGIRQDEPAFIVENIPVTEIKNETVNSSERSKNPEQENLPYGSYDQVSADPTIMRQESSDAEPKFATGHRASGEEPAKEKQNSTAPEETNLPSKQQNHDLPNSSGHPESPAQEKSSSAGYSETGSGTFTQTVTEVADLCASKPQHKLTEVLDFPSMKNNCTWFPSGFEGKDYIQGVTGQEPTVKPSLLEGSVLCSMELSSGNQERKTWVYDDEFYFTLNRKILVSSHTNSLSRFNKSNDFYDYDFSKLIGMRYQADRGGGIYCFGFDPLSGSNSCSFPATQKVAPVSYLVNQNQATKIGALVKSQKKMDFELFVTGDNDPRIDCRHAGLKFDLTLYYVPKQ